MRKSTYRVKKSVRLSPTKTGLGYSSIQGTSIERISQDTVNVIKKFYQQDDISRMAPGKRDAVTIRSDTRKEKVQKRHLYMSIKVT